ncbi:hypothetical protein CYMTET_13198 [Cymbomonas tetramitiformis]|uniref:Uncharacterized protein n=1 Tax=Cymbomonas tetramitiformis TaxID=36881 RepID=A0AAE0LBB5_9CHLO|nr:hypothetical protein CYMTET_13198 [Cymbomonas tetramitiformis]
MLMIVTRSESTAAADAICDLNDELKDKAQEALEKLLMSRSEKVTDDDTNSTVVEDADIGDAVEGAAVVWKSGVTLRELQSRGDVEELQWVPRSGMTSEGAAVVRSRGDAGGAAVGAEVGGDVEGAAVEVRGDVEGAAVGADVVDTAGEVEGDCVGSEVGNDDGVAMGDEVGREVGIMVGEEVEGDAVGVEVGEEEGDEVGEAEGDPIGVEVLPKVVKTASGFEVRVVEKAEAVDVAVLGKYTLDVTLTLPLTMEVTATSEVPTPAETAICNEKEA